MRGPRFARTTPGLWLVRSLLNSETRERHLKTLTGVRAPRLFRSFEPLEATDTRIRESLIRPEFLTLAFSTNE